MSVEDAAEALGLASAEKLEAIEAGTKAPSRPLLLRMSQKYRRSLLNFYLAEPPRKAKRGEDFRTLPDRSAVPESMIEALTRDLSIRQSLVRAALEDEEAEPLPFVGSARVGTSHATLRQSIQKTLQFELADFRNSRTADAAFNYMRERAESAGIFVLLVGNLGSWQTAIPVEGFRGFAIADPIAPFVVINDQDARTAWSFTLLHEIVHVWLGKSGVSGVHAEQTTEKFCNDVASELLLPTEELSQLVLPRPFDVRTATDALSAFAGDRKLSRAMVAYRLYKAGAIQKAAWTSISTELERRRSAESPKKQRESDTGPDYYTVRRHRLGKALLDFTARSIDAGTLSAVKAAKVLGVKPRTVFPLLAGGRQ